MFDFRKILLIFLGTVFVGLGVIGMFLPLVPTTVFLLLAAFCYSRSSERFHTWLITHRWCGRYIKNYTEGVGMTVRDKVTTISLLWATLSVSMWFVFERHGSSRCSRPSGSALLLTCCGSRPAAMKPNPRTHLLLNASNSRSVSMDG